MGVREYTSSRKEANARYDAKTYTKINIALRKDEDKDILASWENARKQGFTSRQWLRSLYDR